MFGKLLRKAAPKSGLAHGSAADELKQLKGNLAGLEAKYRALLIERDFWVEQGRNLQNQLSSFQRMYAGLFDQLGRGVVTEESIADNLALASEQLRAPLTNIEATRALIAMQDPATQGAYTSAHKRVEPQRIDQ